MPALSSTPSRSRYAACSRRTDVAHASDLLAQSQVRATHVDALAALAALASLAKHSLFVKYPAATSLRHTCPCRSWRSSRLARSARHISRTSRRSRYTVGLYALSMLR
jgi:hypothetical protein